MSDDEKGLILCASLGIVSFLSGIAVLFGVGGFLTALGAILMGMAVIASTGDAK